MLKFFQFYWPSVTILKRAEKVICKNDKTFIILCQYFNRCDVSYILVSESGSSFAHIFNYFTAQSSMITFIT